MVQLYYRYAAMNAGKSIALLTIAHNYEERGDTVRILTPSIDDRFGVGVVGSRIGLRREAEVIRPDTNLWELMVGDIEDGVRPACILVDEGQFLSRNQVKQLCWIVDQYDVPVIVFGLKTDFQGNLFPGSEALLCYADKIEELKTICHKCGRKATFNMRVDQNGNKIEEGEQVMIGGNESYVPVCREHFRLR